MVIGDIIRDIASLDFDLYGGVLPKIIHIAGTTYAIAYQGSKNDGYLRTVRISNDGATLELISFLEFDTTNGAHPWIIHIAGTVYAIAYVGPGLNGTLKTFNMDGHDASLNSGDAVHFESQDIPRTDTLGPAGESGILVLLGSRDLRLIASADGISVSGRKVGIGVFPDIHLDGARLVCR
ncbi:hypothetical protein ES703_104743 [subsurface metagenome]